MAVGVPVLREKADVAKLAAYDVVICATGSLPIIPNIPGVEKPIAVDCLSAINGAKPVGKKVIPGRRCPAPPPDGSR